MGKQTSFAVVVLGDPWLHDSCQRMTRNPQYRSLLATLHLSFLHSYPLNVYIFIYIYTHTYIYIYKLTASAIYRHILPPPPPSPLPPPGCGFGAPELLAPRARRAPPRPSSPSRGRCPASAPAEKTHISPSLSFSPSCVFVFCCCLLLAVSPPFFLLFFSVPLGVLFLSSVFVWRGRETKQRG